jgi:hypothetical protein
MSVSFDALTLIAGKLLCSGLCYKKSALSFSAGGESCRDADIPRRASVIVLEGLKRRGFHAPFIDFKTSQKGRLWGSLGYFLSVEIEKYRDKSYDYGSEGLRFESSWLRCSLAILL